MKLGLASYTYSWAIGVTGSDPEKPMSAAQLVETAARLGVHVVQIADNLPLDILTHEELSSLRDTARSRGISIEVGTRGIAHEHLGRYLEIARFFDAPFPRIVVDTKDHHPEPDEVVRSLSTVMPMFERADVRLAIENHDRFTTKNLLDILHRIDSSHIGICLDTVNSYGAQEGMRAVAEALAPWTINLHVKDYSIARLWHLMGFTIEGRPAGRGMLDIPWLLDLVKTKGRGSPNAIIELWTPREESLESTIRTEATWARESVRYMRTLVSD